MARKLAQFKRLVMAILRRDNLDHISDLWGEFNGSLVLCGKPPNQYLMVKKYMRRV